MGIEQDINMLELKVKSLVSTANGKGDIKEIFDVKIGHSRGLLVEDIADMFCRMEENDLRPAYILMNARMYVNIRKWGRDSIFIINDERLRIGMVAEIWGAKIFISKDCQVNSIYLSDDIGFIYRFDLTCIANDDLNKKFLAISKKVDELNALIQDYEKDFILKSDFEKKMKF